MSLTVADVLELKELGELELVAGSQGLSREVKGIAIFEDENAVPWIQENALVITNGTAISQNMGCVEDIIASLRSNGAAGMLVKFGRMLPRSSEQVASACDKHALPLIALPPQSSPTRLINVISREMFAREDKEPNRPCDVDLLRSIIIEGEDWRILKDRIASLGWSTRREMGVALLKCDDEGTPPPAADLQNLCRDEGFEYLFPLYGKLVALADLSGEKSPQSLLASKASSLMRALERVRPRRSWRMGVGRVRGNMLMLSVSYKEALYALCMGMATEAKSRVVPYQTLGVFACLLQPKSRRELDSFLSQLVAVLEQHDKHNNTELSETLLAYARTNMSVKGTAEALYVHPNTVRYRVDMIRKVMSGFVLSENIGVSLEVICTFLRWRDAYRAESGE